MDVGVFGFISDIHGRILLVRDATRQKLWTLPGGAVEFRELLPEALKRELCEEAGVRIAVVGLAGIFSQYKTPGIVILFDAQILEGVPRPDGIETSECKFMTVQEIEKERSAIKAAQFSMIIQRLSPTAQLPIYSHFLDPAGRH